MQTIDRVLRTADVLEIANCGRTKLWAMIRAGEFPPRRRISGGLTGWLASDVDEWLRSRPVDADDKAA